MTTDSANPTRRAFLTATALAPVWTACSSPAPEPASLDTSVYRDKARGHFMGAAIADAMGGPVECQHYKRIAKRFPEFDTFLPYRKPPGLIDLKPGYALGDAPGNITDDSYIRLDLSRYLLETDPPYTAATFAPWLLANAEFANWWNVAVRPLKRIEAGEVEPEQAGVDHQQGGGGGWWQPVAMLHAADPAPASKMTTDLCRIWKAPLERDILSSVVAGQAAAYADGATVDSVVDEILSDCGPLAKQLFTRAVEIARKAGSNAELYEQLYQHCLVTECTNDADGPMPPELEPEDYNDGFYTGILFAEQQPFALAYFVYGQGDPKRTVLTAVKGGRDADSIATNSASWLGALAGESVWPREWLDTVQSANLERVNLSATADALIERGLSSGTVNLSGISS